MVHADLICVPQLMSGEQALAAQIAGTARVSSERFRSRTARSCGL
jgi:hypothetical protein